VYWSWGKGDYAYINVLAVGKKKQCAPKLSKPCARGEREGGEEKGGKKRRGVLKVSREELFLGFPSGGKDGY